MKYECKCCKRKFTYSRSAGHRKTQCNSCGVRKRRHKLKLMAIEYLGGQCIKCGYTKCAAALEFHHRDPNIKLFGIGSSGHTYSWERTKNELDKCDLVCANCHREINY